jgi:hypothetical protein
MAPVTLIVVGAGQRGAWYARWAGRHPDRARVVAVAEPGGVRRARLIKSGPRESLASHLAVLAAERSRLNGTVESIPP